MSTNIVRCTERAFGQCELSSMCQVVSQTSNTGSQRHGGTEDTHNAAEEPWLVRRGECSPVSLLLVCHGYLTAMALF